MGVVSIHVDQSVSDRIEGRVKYWGPAVWVIVLPWSASYRLVTVIAIAWIGRVWDTFVDLQEVQVQAAPAGDHCDPGFVTRRMMYKRRDASVPYSHKQHSKEHHVELFAVELAEKTDLDKLSGRQILEYYDHLELSDVQQIRSIHFWPR